MPDYVPISDLTLVNSIGDNDLFPLSDGSGAYAVKGSTIKSYAASDAAAAAASAADSAADAADAKSTATDAKSTAEGAATTAAGAVTTANAAVTTANNAKALVDSAYAGIGPFANLVDQKHLLEATGWTESDGVYTGTAGAFRDAFTSDAGGYPGTSSIKYQPNMSYTFSVWAKCNDEGLSGNNGIIFYLGYTDGTYDYIGMPRSQTSWKQFVLHTNPSKTLRRLSCGRGMVNYNSDHWSLKEMQLVAGGQIPYVPYQSSAVDLVMRGLQPTGDTTDRAPEIMAILLHYRYCELGAGDYHISNIVMPEKSVLRGKGNATRVYMLDSAAGTAISMGSECRVDSLCLYGSTDENYDQTDNSGQFPGSENMDFAGATNLWEDGDRSIGESGYLHMVLSESLPAGSYYLEVDSLTNSNPESTYALIYFSTSQTTSIGPDSIIAKITIPKGTNKGAYFDIPSTAYSVRIYSAGLTNYSGCTAEWDGIHIYAVAGRNGIGWVQGELEVLQAGSISACRIERFSGAGILGMDTGTPVNRGLTITNCQIQYCNVGVYFRRNCEFCQVVGCMMFRCYYGILNRGGNNIFEACVISGNYINAQQDMDEGTNTGHGMINSCKLHHSGYSANNNYALVIRDTGRIVVAGCEISDKILLKSTNGNVLSDNAMFDVDLEVNGGQCTLIANSVFRSAVMQRISNTAAVISNCYLRDGTPVDWSA